MTHYKENLIWQLEFLKRSCDIFDEGNEDEAIRIATTLRTLFRDTNNSISLITLLNQKDIIKLVSTLTTDEDDHIPNNINISFSIPIMLTSDGRKPLLESTTTRKLLTIESWLNEKIMIIDGESFTREDIIITAANKDGGAHVPKKLNQKAIALKKSIGNHTIYENKRSITNDLKNHHFIILRQLAYEVLISKQIYETNNLDVYQPEKSKNYHEHLLDAECFEKEKRYHKAIESYKKAIKAKSNSSEVAYNNMGNVFTELNEIDDAKDSYLNAIKLNPGYTDPLFNLSILYFREKRYDLAIMTYEKILAITPEHHKTRHNYQVILNYLTLEDTISYQYENVFCNSTNTTYLKHLCCGLINFQKYIEALDVAHKILKSSKEDVLALYYSGFIYLKLMDSQNAKEAFDLLSRLNITDLDLCLNILEYNLIYNQHYNTELIRKYYNCFKNNNNAIMLITMIDIFFQARNGINIDDYIQKFIKSYPNTKLNYSLNDIDEWITMNNTDNRNLLTAITYFKSIL